MEGLRTHRRLWVAARTLAAEGAPDPDRYALEPLRPLAEAERQLVEASMSYLVGVCAMAHPGLGVAQRLAFRGTRLADDEAVGGWLMALAPPFSSAHALAVRVAIFATLLAADPAPPEALATLRDACANGRLWTAFDQLFGLVPALAENLDHANNAGVLLRHLHHAQQLHAEAGLGEGPGQPVGEGLEDRAVL